MINHKRHKLRKNTKHSLAPASQMWFSFFLCLYCCELNTFEFETVGWTKEKMRRFYSRVRMNIFHYYLTFCRLKDWSLVRDLLIVPIIVSWCPMWLLYMSPAVNACLGWDYLSSLKSWQLGCNKLHNMSCSSVSLVFQ